MSREINLTLISLNDYLTIGLRIISAFIKAHGYQVNTIFFKNMTSSREFISEEAEERLLIDLIKSLNTTIVGISVCSPYLKVARQITIRIRKELNIPVIWGGIHPTIMPEESIKIADMICIEGGEHTLLGLMQNLFEHKDLIGIKGLWFREGEEIIKNENRPPVNDLDTLPFPDYSDKGRYFIEANRIYEGDPALFRSRTRHASSVGSWRKGFITIKNEYYMLASRGCPFSCSYCCNSFLHRLHSDNKAVVRWRGVKSVIGEIASITERFPDIKRIQFYDALFPWDKQWISEFCSEYKKYVHRPFYISSHPDVLKRDNLVMLKEAGVDIVGFGIESGSERVRKDIYERDVTDKAIINAAKIIHEQKISPHYYIILDNPFEGWEDRKAGLELLLSLPRPFILIIHSLYLFPGVSITKKVLSLLFGKASERETEEQLQKQLELGMDFTTRPIVDLFWKGLYSLTAKIFVPKFLIRLFSKSVFLQRHPKIMDVFARICDYIKFIWSGTIRLAKREISLQNIKNNLSLSQFADIYH